MERAGAILYFLVCTIFQEPSLATVHGILILDNDGKRIQCKVCIYHYRHCMF